MCFPPEEVIAAQADRVLVLKAQTALTSEVPVNAARRDHAGDLLAESLFERRAPRDKVKAEAVVDHREPPGGEGDALSIEARDVIAVAGRAVGKAGLLG